MTTPDADPMPHSDAPAYEPLPLQEEYWRAPARFGSVPVDAEPKGWDRYNGFRKLYPRIDLPTQIVERVALGIEAPHEPNRLIWGDCLHVMRQIPSATIDLIYIDPPFFSGRNYNILWGDNNELRSFTDIWEGGMDGYLIWLNARLFEMKRLLKPTGSIYVHCDWHASHYIKVEMDKIFGHGNFRNEIVWKRTAAHANARRSGSIHDIVFFYSKSGEYKWNEEVRQAYDQQYIDQYYRYEDDQGRRFMSDNITAPAPGNSESANSKRYEWKGVTPAPSRVWLYSKEQMEELDRQGRIFYTRNGFPRGIRYLDEQKGMALQDIWTDVEAVRSWHSERLGYPTQKPEALLERIIKASSNEGAVVADFFVGGGTTAAVAQRLGRRFVACDQSRVAVAVTAERLKQAAVVRSMETEPYPDFTVEQWGIYEADRLSETPPDGFREFVLRAYGAHPSSEYEGIHGWHNRLPVWVGESALDSQASAGDVQAFANAIRRTTEYQQAHLRDGAMLAWGFDRGAREAARELREREAIDVNFVNLRLLQIGEADFRERIVGASTDKADYSEFLTFVRPPVVSVGYRALGGRSVTLDAGDSVVVNTDAKIVNVQWDFDYNGERFAATPGYSFSKDKKPQLLVTHKFERTGKVWVACRVQDSRGGEGLWTGEVEVK